MVYIIFYLPLPPTLCIPTPPLPHLWALRGVTGLFLGPPNWLAGAAQLGIW